MCDWTIAAAVIGGLSAVQQGFSASQMGRYNAKVQRQAAADAIERGGERESMLRQDQRRLAGTQRARLAANGVDLTIGTPIDILGDTAQTGTIDALTILRNAEREAAGHRNQAELDRATGINALRGSLLSGGATILTGVSRSNFEFEPFEARTRRP